LHKDCAYEYQVPFLQECIFKKKHTKNKFKRKKFTNEIKLKKIINNFIFIFIININKNYNIINL
jgi:hypothetical protein